MAGAIKPVGGTLSVQLIPASALESVSLKQGICTGLTLASGREAMDWPLLEDTSSYQERIENTDGTPLVRHTLTMVCDPESVREQIGVDGLQRMTTEGVVARIETASGVTLLAGWSERFGTEQPLRLSEFRYESGIEPVSRPSLKLVFVGEDTSPALPVREA